MESTVAHVVHEMIDAYNARDLERLMSLFHERAEWHTTEHFIWPGPYRGRDEIRALLEHWWQAWESGHADIVESTTHGDRVALTVDIHGRSAGDGLDVHVPINWVFHVRDGLVDLVRGYDSPELAREALVAGR